MAQVILKQVVKAYDQQSVVKGLDVTIPNGSFTVLVGPSGCGKSTTLRMIAGLEGVTQGEIWIGDKQVNDVPPGKRDLAMVFQNYALYPTMSVFDNIAFGLRNRGVSKKEVKSRWKKSPKLLVCKHTLTANRRCFRADSGSGLPWPARW